MSCLQRLDTLFVINSATDIYCNCANFVSPSSVYMIISVVGLSKVVFMLQAAERIN